MGVFNLTIYLLISMENYLGIVIAFITGVIGPILVLYIKNKLEKKEKPDMVRET